MWSNPLVWPPSEISVNRDLRRFSFCDLGITMQHMQTFRFHLCATIILIPLCQSAMDSRVAPLAFGSPPWFIWSWNITYVFTDYIYTFTVTAPSRPSRGQRDNLNDFNYWMAVKCCKAFCNCQMLLIMNTLQCLNTLISWHHLTLWWILIAAKFLSMHFSECCTWQALYMDIRENRL